MGRHDWIRVAGCILLAGGALAAEHPSAPDPSVVLQRLKASGVPADSATFSFQEQWGKPPHFTEVEICFYQAKLGDASWWVAVGSGDAAIWGLWGDGGVPRTATQQPLESARAADLAVDDFLESVGVDARSYCRWDTRLRQAGARWTTSRFARGPDGSVLRSGIDVDLDAKTGKLLDYWREPPAAPVAAIPVAQCTTQDAVTHALAAVANEATEHHGPGTGLRLLDIHRFVTWRKGQDQQTERWMPWLLRVAGRARRRVHVQVPGVTPSVEPCLWEVWVDAETGVAGVAGVAVRSELTCEDGSFTW